MQHVVCIAFEKESGHWLPRLDQWTTHKRKRARDTSVSLLPFSSPPTPILLATPFISYHILSRLRLAAFVYDHHRLYDFHAPELWYTETDENASFFLHLSLSTVHLIVRCYTHFTNCKPDTPRCRQEELEVGKRPPFGLQQCPDRATDRRSGQGLLRRQPRQCTEPVVVDTGSNCWRKPRHCFFHHLRLL